jgi:hypothetical protein
VENWRQYGKYDGHEGWAGVALKVSTVLRRHILNSDFFDKLNDWIRGTENSIVNFLSAFAPWIAPIIPAYMTFQHASGTLEFPFLVAVSAAAVVEVLGFSAVSTFLAFWFYNRRNQAESRKAPILVVVVAFLFYLSLIVSSNVLLDAFPSERWAEIAVRALFTLQTIPAALLVAVRTQHRELLSEIAREKAQKVSEKQQKVSEPEESPQKVSSNFPKDWRQVRSKLSEQELANLAAMDAQQVRQFSERYGIDVRTVTNWRKYAREEMNVSEQENR